MPAAAPGRLRGALQRAWLAAVMLIVCAGTSRDAQAAEPARVQPLNFRRLAPENGLPGAQILRIFQDSRGFMWFGTEGGLARYDGRNFRVFQHDPKDRDSLAHNIVWDIVEDDRRDLWLATDGGLDRWNRQTERFTHYPHRPGDPASLGSDNVRQLARDRDGTLWLGTLGGGLNRFDPRAGKFERFPHEAGNTNSPSGDWVLCLHQDRRGVVWFGTEANGLNSYDPAARRFRVYTHDPGNPQSLSNDRVTGICEDRDGYLWIGTDWGISRLNPARDSFERLLFEQEGPDVILPPRIATVRNGSHNRVWAGTVSGGLLRFDAATREFVRYHHDKNDLFSLSGDHVTALFEDGGGSLWAGHYPSGVSYANHTQPFRHYRATPGQTNTLSSDIVVSFLEDPDGALWVGTDGGGLNRFDRAAHRWTVYRHDYYDPGTLGANEVLAMCLDSRGRFWLGTWNGGMDLFDPAAGSFRHYRQDSQRTTSLGHHRVWRILEDRQRTLWIATIGGGIDRFFPDEDRFVHYRSDPDNPRSLNHDNVWSLLLTKSGALWAGTYAGLARWEPDTGTWRRFLHSPDRPQSLSHNFVVDLLEDTSGAIWAATYGGGLNRLDPVTEQFRHFRAQDGLPSDMLTGLLEDDSGVLWISTVNGLARFDPREGRFRTYDESNGLQGRHFSRNARLKLSSGELAFGGNQGFNLFDPRAIEANTNPPPVVLTQFDVFNEPMRPGASNSPLTQSIVETRVLKIPARFSVIGFEFAALDYRNPGRNQYAYKLEGFDADWRKAGPERRATYTNLDPGRYRLRVKASNNEGVWNEAGAILELVVVPPWWRTWYFRSASVAALAAALAGIVWTVSTTRLKARLLEAEERKRAQEEKLELERKMWESQKFESLGVLAGGIAHEFNNMLTAILGNASLALDETPANSQVRESLKTIQSSSERAALLCRQMLAYAGRARFVAETIRINTLVNEMTPLLRTSLPPRAVFKVDLGKDVPAMEGDAGQIQQVVTNLVINASEALNEGGGFITIATGVKPCSPEDLCSPFLDQPLAGGRYVWIEVSDTGCGMSPETQRRIFEPFFTTKFMGRGLGLSAVLGVMRKHRGSIQLRSELGQGSAFRVFFPAGSTDTSKIQAGSDLLRPS